MMFSLLAQAAGQTGTTGSGAQDFGSDGLDLGSTLTLGDSRPVRDVLSKPADLVNLIVPNLFVFGGIILMIMIIMAGYKFIANGEKGLQEAQEIAGNALLGFIIMFAAYWIVQIIKIITGADIPL